MLRAFKILLFLLVVGAIGLVGYAYVGPYFGADFSAPQAESRTPISLDAQ